MAVVNTGMPKPEMRKLLKRSKAGPIGCAVGIGEEAAYGLFVMHKTRRGKALEKLLKEDFPDAKNVRFGTAFVDPEEDPKLVQLQLNRNAPGITRKLIKTLKGTGYTKVRLVTDDGETEEHQEADDTPVPPDEPDDDEPVAAAPAEAAAPAAPGAPPPPDAPAPPAAPSPAERDAQVAKLSQALAALASGIPAAVGTDEVRKAGLLKLARDANVAIKTNNLKTAAVLVAQLKAGLSGEAAATPAKVDENELDRIRIQWNGVRQQVAADVATLRSALQTTYGDQPFFADINRSFAAKTGPMLARFDNRLDAALAAVVAAEGGAEQPARVTEAKAVLKDYLAFAMTDPFITDLDSNPFVTLGVRQRTTTALAAVAKQLV